MEDGDSDVCSDPLSVRKCVGFSLSVCDVSEGALQQTVAATARRTLVLSTKPVHHVTGVSSVTAAEAEVGGASYSHVTDGALEGQTFTDGTLSPTSLTATVTAVHPKLCREKTDSRCLRPFTYTNSKSCVSNSCWSLWVRPGSAAAADLKRAQLYANIIFILAETVNNCFHRISSLNTPLMDVWRQVMRCRLSAFEPALPSGYS